MGLESIAFLDDNPVERNLVRIILPQVMVIELPTDPALYTRTLLASGIFECVVFSAEDRARAEMYQGNARRIALQKLAGDVDSYLASLQMIMTVQPFDAIGRARIAQLINKSNQFNLTTKRYTEAEIAEVEADLGCFTMQIRLLDNFGDNGMICVVICRPHNEDWAIDTWLMSCRVLGRKVEQAVLQEIILAAKARGIKRLFGTYRPTARNEMVADHYPKLGFSLVEARVDGSKVWSLDILGSAFQDAPIKIQRLADK